MASGGHKPKGASTEPRQRSTWQRTTSMSDKEDNLSINSIPNELRPNNWDFSDWQPTNKDQTKRRKKGNPEWEREQSLTQDSPPPSEKQYGTPRTFPRTKITSNTPKSQRVALENLRQRMTFSDQEDAVSNEGERNNERNIVTRRENPPNYTRQDTGGSGAESLLTRPVANRRDDRNNRNNNKQNDTRGLVSIEGKPDSSQIVGRLMQIRDYIKQAGAMMESLKKSGDPLISGRTEKISQLIKLWREQETSCLRELEYRVPGYRDEMDRLQKLIDHLREQERGYTGLLETVLSLRENVGVNDMSRDLTPNLESVDDTQSLDLDVQSEVSEDRSPSASSRPRIEDKLGLTSDNDDDGGGEDRVPSESSDDSSNMDDTVVSGRKTQEWDYERDRDESAIDAVMNPVEAAEQLAALRQQQELLTKLVEQQEQMRALRGRQAALLALQQDAERKLARARENRNEANSHVNQLRETASNLSNRVEALSASQTNAGRQPDRDLQDLRQQLQYLKNELKTQTQNENVEQAQRNVPPARPERPPSPRQAVVPPTQMTREQMQARLQVLLEKRDKLDQLLDTELSGPGLARPTPDMSREQLRDKLMELQAKKSRMDKMLQELQSLREDPFMLLNNASREAAVRDSNIESQMSEGEAAIARAEATENMANDVLGVLDVRQKQQKLSEVRERLGHLRSLVRYYQSAEGVAEGLDEEEDQSSLPVYSDYGAESDANRDRGYAAMYKESKLKPVQETKTNVNIPVQVTQQSDENNSSSSSDTESQLSSLGPWGDDPEIQEKVRKLKAAKEKLKHLQSLVAMVQYAPDGAGDMPDNMAEMDGESQATQTDDRNNASLSEGEVATAQSQRDEYYQKKMAEQFEELAQLKEEKERLLTIQGQLQELHDRFQQTDSLDGGQAAAEEEETKVKGKSNEKKTNTARQENTQQASTGPSVTFSSNEEVYDKMRKQRMLREELRDKKKQLESIMKKDRNKKQYIKNQDNQSDTGTYNTDAFGTAASADATMATWGGSTVDNLESITEDGGGDQQDNEDEDDDGYPLDGIMQVEEEEEENNSDNETYTIEEDVRQRRKARGLPDEEDTSNRQTKSKQSFPRPSGKKDKGARPKEAWNTRPPNFSKWSRTSKAKSRQENYRSAEEIVQDDEETDGTSKPERPSLEMLQQQLEQTSRLCQTLLGDQAASQMARLSVSSYAGGRAPVVPDIQQQLQQQQLMMSLTQCHQQMAMQQMEIQAMQRQMQGLLLAYSEGPDTNDSGLSSDLRVRSYPSLFSPLIPRPSPPMMDGFLFNPVFGSREQPPRSPERLLRSVPGEDSVFESDRPQQRLEPSGDRNTRYSRMSKLDSYVKKKRSSPSNSGQRVASASAQTRTDSADRGSQTRETGPVPPLQFEEFLAKKKREFLERNKLYPRSSDGPSATGASRTSSSQYRPGLSAGISGAGYLEDGRSVASSVQSSNVAAITQALSDQAQGREQREVDDPNELSLFETLRETIYSEVATLISQNENRPHYLIELFRELQLLTTDYLRQRVLYDIKDVVSKYLVDENTDSVSAPPPPWMNTAMGNFNASELTPSESLVTSDDEEVKTKVKGRSEAQEKRKALLRSGSLKNDQFDYQEAPEMSSSVSTPSNSYWDSPFAQDSLGETVIHLDKTLQRMREYEKKLAEKGKKIKSATSEAREVTETNADGSSSAVDQGSEASGASDVPYPRIDTQQLDQQIKSIMTEVVPVIKEHMDNMCSPQFLAYIKRLVLSLTRQYDSGQEFARFFHRQLGSILQDTLAKYEGRKMRECGEDLLVDMSEVLFNELAFFRLMQDLDDPLIAEKMQQAQYGSDENEMDQQSDESDTTESSTANATNNEEINEDAADVTQTEEEDLGKSRDDAFANEVEIQDADDKDEEPESLYKTVQVELAVSETKPYTRIGSDEDDEDADDESQSNEDPSETAVSINAKMVINGEDYDEDNSIRPDVAVMKIDGASGKQDSGNSKQEPTKSEVGVAGKGGEEGEGQGMLSDQEDADQGASSGKTEQQKLNDQINGDLLNGDIEVITMDDLPASLTVMSPEELQLKVAQEQQNNSGAAAMLNSIDIENELAGDGAFLKEPDEASG